MKHFITIAFFLSIGFAGFGQSSGNVNNNPAVSKMSLDKRLTVKVLDAYQKHSGTKIEDLFAYFQLLTESGLTTDLKKEVIRNINQLFGNQDALVVDFTSASQNRIPLQQFIRKLLACGPATFTLPGEADYNSVTHNSWNTSYTVIFTKDTTVTKIKVAQAVYFFEETKQFGAHDKSVLSMYLGEMSVY